MGVTKNILYLTSSYIFQKILTFIYFIFLARLLGPEDAGKYLFAVSFAMAFSILTDLGLNTTFIREVAKNKERLELYLGNILSLKIILSIFTFLILVLSIGLFNKPPLIQFLVYLAGISILFDSFAHLFYGIFRAYQNLKYESKGVILHQSLVFVLGLIVLFLRLPLPFLMLTLIVASFFFFVYPLILSLKKLKIKIRFNLDKKIFIPLLIIALPFALTGVFDRLYAYFDAIALGKLVGDIYVGWYKVAYKLTFAFQFIPSAFSAVLFPAFSIYYISNRERLIKIFEKSIFYLMLIAIPLLFGSILLAEELILKIYGPDYYPSILPFQILMVNLVFIFLYSPVGALFNASGRQLQNTFNIGTVTIINLILNLALIPSWFAVGASVASLISNIILFSLGYYFNAKIIKYNKIYLIKSFFKIFFAGLLMGLAILSFKKIFPFLLVIFLASLIYLGVVYLIGGIKREDLEILKNVIINRKKEKEMIKTNGFQEPKI